MKYNELFTADRGLFKTIFEVDFSMEYEAIFGALYLSSDDLDALALYKFGSRQLVSSITPETYKPIVNSIIAINLDCWEREARTMLLKYDALKPTQSEVTHSQSDTVNESSSDVTSEAQKAFNDTDFSDGKRESATNSKERSQQSDYTHTTTALSGNVSDAIAKEYKLAKTKWVEAIISALIDDMTISIY